jgi:hypothetical protein
MPTRCQRPHRPSTRCTALLGHESIHCFPRAPTNAHNSGPRLRHALSLSLSLAAHALTLPLQQRPELPPPPAPCSSCARPAGSRPPGPWHRRRRRCGRPRSQPRAPLAAAPGWRTDGAACCPAGAARRARAAAAGPRASPPAPGARAGPIGQPAAPQGHCHAPPHARRPAAQVAVEEKAAPKAIFRKDYAAPPYLIENVDLTFQLGEEVTHVTSKLHLRPNHSAAAPPALFLNGREDVKLVSLKVNGADVPASGYQVRGGSRRRPGRANWPAGRPALGPALDAVHPPHPPLFPPPTSPPRPPEPPAGH